MEDLDCENLNDEGMKKILSLLDLNQRKYNIDWLTGAFADQLERIL